MPTAGRGASNSHDRKRTRRLNNLGTATIKVRWPKGVSKVLEVRAVDEDGMAVMLQVYDVKVCR